MLTAIDGLDGGGRVIVRDPWGKGTRYLVDWSEFVAHWAGDIVNWGGK